jgi:hypothetical protein
MKYMTTNEAELGLEIFETKAEAEEAIKQYKKRHKYENYFIKEIKDNE